MSVLAIDAGTTGVTAVVVTPQGTIAARGVPGVRAALPRPGWVEHSPEDIWQATLEATRMALEGHDTDGLQAIGITNQRETILLWDRETSDPPGARSCGRTVVPPISASGCVSKATRSASLS
ncbi:MAG TPA: FGGY family carbohydrate kinase [Nocardioidaceae bacterium]|nr:FGGY family carbohydrate kinase [Nocardioidaceae bacterium]